MGLEFDFEDCIRKTAYIRFGKLVEGVIYADVCATPVFARAGYSVEGIFTDEGEFCVKGNSDSSVAGELKCRAIIE